MTPFNVEHAKGGDPVITRDGRSVRFICFDRKSTEGRPIVYLVKKSLGEDEAILACTERGHYNSDEPGADSQFDLFMAPTHYTRYIAVNTCFQPIGKTFYTSKLEVEQLFPGAIVATVEWER